MITATSRQDGSFLTLNATVNGAVVYLDNWALVNLAKGDESRRKRFIGAIRSGVDLLFSVTNAAELSGPQGRSAEILRLFLDEIGPHWFPARLDPTEAIRLEIKGESSCNVCASQSFLESYVADRRRKSPGRVIDLSDDFFRLGAVLDWVEPQRGALRRSSEEFDELLRSKMMEARRFSKRDPMWLDRKFPWVTFDPTRPACFIYLNLLRIMTLEAISLKKGDGLDFCHTVIAGAFASFATLDKHWKRRMASLPKPNRLPRIYSQPELDNLVTDMETYARNTVVLADGPAFRTSPSHN